MNKQRIAIIGSGISGLTSAYLLHRDHDITVFEANDYIGGHTHTVEIKHSGETYQVDTGFIVCNDRNYENFLNLMKKLDVALKPTEMSFSVRNNLVNLEYNGHSLNTLFSQRRNFLRPKFYRLVYDILKFNKAAKAYLENHPSKSLALGEFVHQERLSTIFKDNYLMPMVAAIWSCSLRQAEEFPLEFFLRFFLNHGLLDIKNRPQWYVVDGGSKSYVKPMVSAFEENIKLSCPVVSVTRNEEFVEVRHSNGVGKFDQVIFACHSDQALKLLENPNADENSVLGDLEYQQNDVILHSDKSLMPKNELSWASWNFLAGERKTYEPPLVTYCMNILQSIQSKVPFFVSLNARHKIAPEKILQEFIYSHPVYSHQAIQAQSRRDRICGVDRIHYCGAYWYSGFHEDGVRSALDVVKRFGIEV
jgi:predicted NAD/FAD-binding protein